MASFFIHTRSCFSERERERVLYKDSLFLIYKNMVERKRGSDDRFYHVDPKGDDVVNTGDQKANLDFEITALQEKINNLEDDLRHAKGKKVLKEKERAELKN
jgi:hypothetical protein